MNFPLPAQNAIAMHVARCAARVQAFREIPTEFRPKVGSVCVRAIVRIDDTLSCDVARKK